MATKIGYMCRTDYLYHLDKDLDGVTIYPSEEAANQHLMCAEHCGLVKLKIEIIQERPK